MQEAERKRIPLHTKILFGLVAGTVLGGVANSILGQDYQPLKVLVDHFTDPIGQLFLRLLLLLVVPLVFSSLLLGIAGLGDLRRIGRIGVKSLLYTLIMSAISVVIGLTLANTIKPGKRVDKKISDELSRRYSTAAQKTVETATATAKTTDTPFMKVVKTIVPTNVFY
jgi:DAACS family dicarboxylate/amino acid:cation (Na+ or H+) symporter